MPLRCFHPFPVLSFLLAGLLIAAAPMEPYQHTDSTHRRTGTEGAYQEHHRQHNSNGMAAFDPNFETNNYYLNGYVPSQPLQYNYPSPSTPTPQPEFESAEYYNYAFQYPSYPSNSYNDQSLYYPELLPNEVYGDTSQGYQSLMSDIGSVPSSSTHPPPLSSSQEQSTNGEGYDQDLIWNPKDLELEHRRQIKRVVLRRMPFAKENSIKNYFKRVITRKLSDDLLSQKEGKIQKALTEMFRRLSVPQPETFVLGSIDDDEENEEVDYSRYDDVLPYWKQLEPVEKVLVKKRLTEGLPDYKIHTMVKTLNNYVTERKARQLMSRNPALIDSTISQIRSIRDQSKAKKEGGKEGKKKGKEEEKVSNTEEKLARVLESLGDDDRVWPYLPKKTKAWIRSVLSGPLQRSDRVTTNTAEAFLTKALYFQLLGKDEAGIQSVADEMLIKKGVVSFPWQKDLKIHERPAVAHNIARLLECGPSTVYYLLRTRNVSAQHAIDMLHATTPEEIKAALAANAPKEDLM